MHARQRLGRAGEDAAAALLRRAGFTVVDRNWSCEHGELDIVARRGDLVVFCEVKTRRSDAFGLPAEAVGWDKRLRLRRLAAAWIAARAPGSVEVRFDVVSVEVRRGRAELTHIPDAF